MASTISVQPGRIRVLKEGSWRPSEQKVGPVVYWMFRDQRLRDNWALIHAVDLANRTNAPVAVVFNLFDQFLGAKARQLGFMLKGLRQLHQQIDSLQIPFFLLQVSPLLDLTRNPFKITCFVEVISEESRRKIRALRVLVIWE